MNFETYYEQKLQKDSSLTKKKAMTWYKQTAAFSAQHKDEDDFEVPDKESVKWFQKEFMPSLKYLRRGSMGVMEDLRLIGDFDEYDAMRRKLVRPLKQDRVWDFDGVRRPLIKAGQIPPPRLATAWQAGSDHRDKQVTRRGCALGVEGIPCDHPRGSSLCNGGAPVLRRIGE